jgi:hypothetical protein
MGSNSMAERLKFEDSANGYTSGGLFEKNPELGGRRLSLAQYMEIRGQSNFGSMSMMEGAPLPNS